MFVMWCSFYNQYCTYISVHHAHSPLLELHIAIKIQRISFTVRSHRVIVSRVADEQ